MIAIGPEREDEHAAIRRVHELAFGQPVEADLVEALRDSDAYLPELWLAASDEGNQLVGHIAFSRARLDSGAPILALAPMAVLPERQREGIGAALVEEGLSRAKKTGIPLVVVVGHAEYYPRFGFEPAAALGITAPFPVPDEAWMAYRLPEYRPQVRGEVVYPPAFEQV